MESGSQRDSNETRGCPFQLIILKKTLVVSCSKGSLKDLINRAFGHKQCSVNSTVQSKLIVELC